MLNAEKFRKEILENLGTDCLISFNKRNHKIEACTANQCLKCLFDAMRGNKSCYNAMLKWLLSEYKEPIKLTRFEYFILDWLLNSQYVRYIARDRNGNLYAHINKPCRVKYEWRGNVSAVDLTIFGELFAFVKWQNTEPTHIKDVLDNCEVVESDL